MTINAPCTCGHPDYRGNDFYCDVALKDLSKLQVEHNGDKILAFHHTKPHWPVHIVVLPKIHITDLTSILIEDDGQLWKELMQVVQKMARMVKDKYGGARVVTNLGKYQDSKHLHVHVCSGDPLAPR